MREAWTPRTQLGIVGTSRFWTFVTLRAPGHAHWAAAGIHTVLPWDGSPTAVVIMCEVAVLRTQVWKVQAFTPPRSKTKKKTFIINLDLKTPQDHPTTHTGCCSPTDAHPATEINSHSWRALAVEGAWCVDAFAVDTNARKHLTFVHIWETTDRQQQQLTLWTKMRVGTCCGRRNPGGTDLRRHFLSLWQSLCYRLDLEQKIQTMAVWFKLRQPRVDLTDSTVLVNEIL